MRLLKREPSDGATNSHKFSLTEFHPSNIPSKYAILSHQWGADEVTMNDLVSGTAQSKPGRCRKLEFCAAQAAHDGIDYFWIDTCCINKESSAELSQAINSMFKWYQNAAKCYVYLSDVSLSLSDNTISNDPTWVSAFQASAWFTRGWTLQELVAPRAVDFFSLEGTRLGDKASLEQQIHNVTKIPFEVLRGSPLDHFTPDERLSWTAGRHTTVEEDAAYCLLGLFDIHMSLIYGEGQQKALARLRRKVDKSSHPIPSQVASTLQTVPFERNSRFTGREAELTKLEARLFATDYTSIWAVTGLGGVGKTQLVLELLYRVQTKNPNCTVMWIPAATRESLHQGYSAVARQLNIPGHEDNNADIETLVQHHLAKVDIGRWLLVFDNADDISLWTATSTLPSQESTPQFTRKTTCLIDRLPRNRQGCIIFTTRDRRLATKVAGPTILTVSEMDEEAATALLDRYLSDSSFFVDHHHQQDAAKLLEELTYLPLAIVQAATYIIENGITVAEYLQLLEEKEEEVIDLLSTYFEDHGRYRDIKNPVATTWLISFEQIREHDQLAAEYLSFIACIHPKDIPLSLLPQAPSTRKQLEAIGTLKAYSFVSKDLTGDFLNLHRLVHLATRNWLRKEEALDSSLKKTVIQLEEVFPDIDEQSRDLWRMYLPHVLQVLESAEFHGAEKHEKALMSRCERRLFKDGRWSEAERLFTRVLNQEESSDIKDYSSISNCERWLAETYSRQGSWVEAEKLAVHALEMSRTKLEADHPGMLGLMSTLALIYRDLGRWTEVEELLVELTEKHKTESGVDDFDAMMVLSYLAAVYQDQGHWAKAEQLLVEGLDKTRRKLGADHPDTLVGMNNLAKTYMNQGRLVEAEQLGVEVLEKRKITLGANHPSTLSGINNLAKTYQAQGRLVEAEQLITEVVEKRKIQLGTDHPSTLNSIAILGGVYWEQNLFTEAEQLYVQVLEAHKRKIGADHPQKLACMHNLAFTWKALGRDEEAIQLMKDKIQREAQVVGVQHPGYLLSVEAVRGWEAERLDQQGTQQSTQVSGEATTTPPTASTFINHEVKGSTRSSSGDRQQKIKLSHRVKDFWRSSSKAGSSSRGQIAREHQ